MHKWIGILIVSAGLSADVPAGDALVPASERFAVADTGDVPDFQRHVVPLLGRLGCNGRACHGSFQGRGDLRLSLFGYDFEMDHAALTGQASSQDGSRVDLQSPDASLVLQKPARLVDHEGGRRFQIGSWEHRLLQRWIESGAKAIDEPDVLERLQLEPPEVVFAAQPESPIPLRVIAVWEDGSREDVTPLCRFRTNDDSVVTVDADGVLTSVGAGDTHVVAFYDNGVAALPVMRPVVETQTGIADAAGSENEIDRFVLRKLAKLGIRPSAVCSDSEFLRRVSLDVTGTLPTPDEVQVFLADDSPDKRLRKIEELLDRPAYAAWWANKLCDFTGCNPNQQAELGQDTAVQWYMWVYSRLRENVSYLELVERIVRATGRREGQSYDDYAAEMSAYFREEDAADYSRRDTLPHYWTRRTLNSPEEMAQAFAHSFLGIRLQCAQCHKHPFAPWTQDDFQQFSEFFENVRFGVPVDAEARYRELAGQVGLNIRGKDGSPVRPDVLKHARAGRTVPWRELYIAPRSQPVSLRLLRSQIVELSPADDPREPIMSWMKDPENPYFAKAFVNRVWASYFHVGMVEPPDDLNPANPPSNPELLEWLTAQFVEHGYDMKWLHRQIVSSDTYQRSWRANETNRSDHRNYSRAVPRRLPAEIVYDVVKQAVAGSDQLAEVRSDLTRRAIGHLSMRLAGTYAMHVFGKPERAVNCDCERVNQPTLLQSIFLQNDPLIDQRLEESGWLRQLFAAEAAGQLPDREELIRAAWLRTLSRPPTDAEVERAVQQLENAESVVEGLRDLLWALINTKEFILN